jgi:exopolysaccharide biosynthesis predicted pyruvyltransferase EpsI
VSDQSPSEGIPLDPECTKDNSASGTLGLVERWRRQILSTMESVVARAGRDAVLLDLPGHSNWGDYLITAGEYVALRAAGVRLSYQSQAEFFSPDALAERENAQLIFLHGGGNLGDLYPRHQEFREFVLQQFRERDIVILPQSIHFNSRSSLDRARRAFESHPSCVMMVRDRRSLEFARSNFNIESQLVPDMAFALGPQERAFEPKFPLLWLARDDGERQGKDRPPMNGLGIRSDWAIPADHSPTILYDRARLSTYYRAGRGSRIIHLYRAAVCSRVDLARRFMAQGAVVVTERLHGHILATLLAIPHVLLENSIGKLGAFYSTWTCGLPQTSITASPEKALDWALAAAEEHTRPRRVSGRGSSAICW